MTSDSDKEGIKASAARFDAELHTEDYRRVHADEVQLRRLLELLQPEPKQVPLDLGTGNGYVAKAIVAKEPTSLVIGLDVAGDAIRRNVEDAERQWLRNIRFGTYDGVTIPYDDDHFDAIICRYAFHHLPRYETTLSELARAIRHGGRFVLSDPIREDGDTCDFINRFQELRHDGHVRMFRMSELVELFARYHYELMDSFESTISFSREHSEEYDALMDSTPGSVKKLYNVVVGEKDISVSFRVLDAVFVNG